MYCHTNFHAWSLDLSEQKLDYLTSFKADQTVYNYFYRTAGITCMRHFSRAPFRIMPFGTFICLVNIIVCLSNLYRGKARGLAWSGVGTTFTL